jgi:hypothetical protein
MWISLNRRYANMPHQLPEWTREMKSKSMQSAAVTSSFTCVERICVFQSHFSSVKARKMRFAWFRIRSACMLGGIAHLSQRGSTYI